MGSADQLKEHSYLFGSKISQKENSDDGGQEAELGLKVKSLAELMAS